MIMSRRRVESVSLGESARRFRRPVGILCVLAWVIAAWGAQGCSKGDPPPTGNAAWALGAAGSTPSRNVAVVRRGVDLAAHLPASAVLYVTVPDLAALWTSVGETGLGRILREPAVRTFLERALTPVQGGLSALRGQLFAGPGANPWESGVVGSLTLAVVEVGPGEAVPDVVLYLGGQTGGALDRLRNALAAMEARWPHGSARETFRAGALEFATVRVAGTPVSYGFLRDGLIAGSRRETIERIAGSMQGNGSDRSLAADPGFQMVRTRVGGDRTLAFGVLNVSRLVDLLKDRSADPRVPALLGRVGIGRIQRVGYGMVVDGTLFRDTLFAQIPGAQTGLIAALLRPNPMGTLEWVPADVTSYSSMAVEWVHLWREIQALAGEIDPNVGNGLRSAVRALEARLSISIETDILSSLSGEVASFQRANPGALVPETAILLGVRDRSKLAGALRRLLPLLPMPITEQDEGNALIFTVPFGGAPGPGIRPAAALSDRHLILATTPEVARFASQPPKTASLKHNSHLADLLRSLPRKAVWVSYTDMARSFSSLYTMALPMLRSVPNAAGMVDVRSLPPPEVITRHLSPMVSAVTVEPVGVVVESRSSIGTGPLVIAGGSIVAAVALPGLLQGQSEAKAAKEAEVVKTIHELHEAQKEFRANHGRYAANLWELSHEAAIPLELGRGVFGGYVWHAQSAGPDFWFIQVKPRTHGRSFYCDQTGVVRVSSVGSVANARSPAYRGRS